MEILDSRDNLGLIFSRVTRKVPGYGDVSRSAYGTSVLLLEVSSPIVSSLALALTMTALQCSPPPAEEQFSYLLGDTAVERIFLSWEAKNMHE